MNAVRDDAVMNDLTIVEFDAGAEAVHASPSDRGTIEMVVCRPAVGEREVLDVGDLVVGRGLVGDNYVARGSKRTPDGAADPAAQITLMNSRVIDLVADGERHRWPLAGDQFFVDFDLSVTNLPAGTRVGIGDAVLEISVKPHRGCAKFAERFGIEAARWVNSNAEQRYRGINAIVVEPGVVRPGDAVTTWI